MAEISVPVILLSIQVVPSAGAAAPYSGPQLLSILKSSDFIHGGPGRITGTVEEKATPNLPLRRRVRLHRDVDGLCVRETWSDAATGAYAFTDINPTYKAYLGVAWLFLVSAALTLAKTLRDEHEARQANPA